MTDVDVLGRWLGGDSTATAVEIHDGRRLSYSELSGSIESMARGLRSRGLCRGELVAVSASDDVVLLTAVLAIWLEGGTASVVDPSLDRERREAHYEEAGVGLVVQGEDIRRVRDGRVLDADYPDAALVLTTSGSSGQPRRVVLGHAGIDANAKAIGGYLNLGEGSRTGILLPLSYSYGLIGQALTTLRAGGTVLALRGVSAFAAGQLEAIRKHRVNGLSSVPAQLRALAEVAYGDRSPLGLAYVASAGAILDPVTAKWMRDAFPEARRFNQYGLTEASPRVCMVEDRADPDAFEVGAIGRPLFGVEVDVREVANTREEDENVIPGFVRRNGMLWVRGPNVMLGYLDDPEATAKVLVDGWLCTGDLVFEDQAGVLHFAGRRDDLVKVAGERVSLSLVTRSLEDAGAREAYVMAKDSARLGTRLVAFVAMPADELSSLREKIRRLPTAWRPASVERLDSLPRTPRGKVDRAALLAHFDLNGRR
jgi:long-chain acyl-CoA synthetase